MVAIALFSSKTFAKMKRHFELAAIPFVSKLAFYRIHRKYLFGVANEAWLNEQEKILNTRKDNSCCLNSDGRCNSASHKAQYLIYSFLYQ